MSLNKIAKETFSPKIPQCPNCDVVDIVLASVSDIKPQNQVWTLKIKHDKHTRKLYFRGETYKTEDIRRTK